MKQYIINLTLAIIIAACATATRGAAIPQTQSADFIATEILGRPTNNSITVNVVPAIDMELNYEYGLAAGQPLAQTALQTATDNLPLETVISPLQPNTRYYYRLRYRASGAAEFTRGASIHL